jgi:amino acid permease
MFSNHKKSDRIDSAQREQYDYARQRVKQKKRLMQHFVVFLAGSILLVIMNGVLGIGKDFFIKNWFIWVILIWSLLLLIHFLNVYILHKFMGKEWEDRQIELLKAKQEGRIKELEQKLKTSSSSRDREKNISPHSSEDQ